VPRTGDYDLCLYVHAEAKAIIEAGSMAFFATLYCTDDPCPGCWKLIHAASISRVVTPNMDSRAQVFPNG
jgi:dCMP deaminase